MTKFTIETPDPGLTADDLAVELERIGRMIEEGFTIGDIRDGWWSVTDLAPDEPNPEYDHLLNQATGDWR